MPDVDTLRSRMQAVAERSPIFSAAVLDTSTSKPTFKTIPCSEKDIADRIHERKATFDTGSSWERRMQQLFAEELKSARTSFDYESARLWQITRILPETQEDESYIAITYHHVILDGLGGLRFAQMLLSPDFCVEPIDNTAGRLPAALDDTVNVKPGYLHLATVIFKELILPLFPKRLVPAALLPIAAWPNELRGTILAKPAVSHQQASNQFLVTSLPEALVSRLRHAGEANGRLSLHAILSTAAMVALFKDDSQVNPSFKIATPLSDRQAELGHPYTGGNYVIGTDWDHKLTADADFWEVTKAYATFLKAPSTRTLAREQWGLLDFLPEPPANEPKQPTAYEKFLLEKADGATPYGSSFEVSNPGFIELPEASGAVKAAWTQPGACTGSAFSINIIGYGSAKDKAAMTLTLSWLEDTAPRDRLSKQEMQTFQSKYVKVLDIITGRQTQASLLVKDLRAASAV